MQISKSSIIKIEDFIKLVKFYDVKGVMFWEIRKLIDN